MSILERRNLAAAGLAIAVLAAVDRSAHAASFGTGDLVIYRVGDGSAALTSAATPVFLDEYSPVGGTVVQSIALPTTGTTALTASGTASSEGLLSLSGDGGSLLVTGYDVASGTTGVASGTGSRAVAIFGSDGTTTSYTTLGTFGSGNNIRSANSVDGSTIYVSGATGVGSFTAVAGTNSITPTAAFTGVTNGRALGVANGQVYVSSGSGSFKGVSSMGTSGAASLIATDGSGNPYQFAFATENGGTTPDTLYVMDNTAGLQKYSLNATTGVFTQDATTLANSALGSTAFTGLTAVTNGTTETLYLTSPTKLVQVIDAFSAVGSTNFGTVSETTLETAGTNEAFRGVAFAPTAAPEPTSLLLLGTAALPMLGRRRRSV